MVPFVAAIVSSKRYWQYNERKPYSYFLGMIVPIATRYAVINPNFSDSYFFMYQFNFVDIILFLGISQGLFLAISLQLIVNRNKAANRILSLLLLCAALMLFGRITVYRIPEDWVWRMGVLVDTTIFLFGPLTYTYVRRSVFMEKPTFRLGWPHYAATILHLGYYLWTLSLPLQEFNTRYAMGALNIMFFWSRLSDCYPL